MMTGNEIREKFLEFFEKKGHRRVRSSSLVPHGDPTLLFTNAGMNQFKDVFLGLEKRDYNRATTAQKCVRAGGKHNDLENVGFTKRHHTFFEMLGNFSFGDYFKKDAVAFAWELLTSAEWFAIPKDKLYVTVFGGAEVAPGNVLGVDEEARDFWVEQRVPADRIVPIPGLKDNFWAMGDTGPCGPCSEIFYDMGPAASEEGHADCKFPCECGRYVEIWNLVFMQFNRDASGVLTPLPKPCVDTGMGLERVSAVLQGVISNYDTDLFVPLIKRAAQLCGVDLEREEAIEEGKGGAASLRVIADHARAATFLISDGVVPSNDGRGYVLRKIIRRAIRHGNLLGTTRPFLAEMVNTVRALMSDAYPELLEPGSARIAKVVLAEETRFANTIAVGSKKLDEALALHLSSIAELPNVKARLLENAEKVSDNAKETIEADLDQLKTQTGQHLAAALTRVAGVIGDAAGLFPVLPGDIAFRFYDTYGLPLDFIADATIDLGIGFDERGFEKAMEEQRAKARASWKGQAKETASPMYAKIAETSKTEKDFYSTAISKDARIEAIILVPGGAKQNYKNTPVSEIAPGQSAEIVLDRTPIYADSGGQTADTGLLLDKSESQILAEVTGAYYPLPGLIAHNILAKETLRVGDRVTVRADASRRARIMRNHSGTHLVHAALRNVLGVHVKQAGSYNAPDHLRFDFTHFAPLDVAELRDIEQQANDVIRHNTDVQTDVTSLDVALATGALAFFGDKYPEGNVRVVTMPDERTPQGFFSKELCGGTHVHRIGDVGLLKLVGERSVAAGIRRIEAVTGIGALEHFQKQAEVLSQVAGQLNVAEDSVLAAVEKMSATVKALEKELEAQRRKGALGQLDELMEKATDVKGIKVVACEVSKVDREGLRQLVDSLRQKLGSGVVALGMPDGEKVALIVGVTKDLTTKVHAGKLIKALAEKVGGSGGGRPDLAEAGGKDTAALKSALSTVPDAVAALL
jgi:alanyl-tRNA synthetase